MMTMQKDGANAIMDVFGESPSMDLDIDEIRDQAELRKEAKWAFPLGIPGCVNLKLAVSEVIGKSGLYSMAKKNKNIKKLLNNPFLLDDLIEALPLPKKQVMSLGSREKIAASVLIMPGERRMLRERQMEKDRTDGVLEFYLINRYYKKIKGEPLFSSIDFIEEVEDKDLFEESKSFSIMDSLLSVLSTGEGRFCGFLLMCVVADRMLERAYRDIFEDTKNAKDAAAFVFAVGSMVDCRWFLDYVYQHNFEIGERHFGGLFYANQTRVSDEESDERFVSPYAPIDLDLTSDETRRVFLIHAQGLQVKKMEFMARDLFEIMRLDFDVPFSIYQHAGEAVENTATCEAMFKSLREEFQALLADKIPTYLYDQIGRLEQNFGNFLEVFSKETEKPDSTEVRKSINRLCEVVPKAKSHRSALVIASLTKIQEAVDRIIDYLDDLLSHHEQATISFQELSKNPLKNAEKLQGILHDLGDIEGEMEGGTEFYREHLDFIRGMLDSACDELEKEIQKDPDSSKSSCDTDRSDHEASKYWEDLLTLSETENQGLKQKLRDLSAQNDHLTTALSQQREQESVNGASEEARELVKKKYVTGDRLSVEECLKLVHILYPDTVILPSAWASAAEYTEFKYTEKLSDYLITLASSYIESVASGTPDAEARKLFPSRVFAANESETTEMGSLRKEREFLWEGKTHYFPKHLRIGVSSDTRNTVRVYFDVIDGQLVIASCGEHKRIL